MRLAVERTETGRRQLVVRRGEAVERDVQPLEGTNISLFNTIIPNWWAENGMTASTWMPGNAVLADRVWIANRCIQMNAQQIASMPLEFHGPDTGGEPAWVSGPDPNWYPNGIGDALHSIVAQLYGWGFACLYVTDRYATGYPRTWTVLDSSQLTITADTGRRAYKYSQENLNPDDVVQIDRNPGVGLQGSSALRAYAQMAWGLLAAGNQSMTVNQGGIPPVAIKSQRKLDADQALSIQEQWMAATQRRSGAPPVLPPELDFTELTFNPKDLALLETQEFNAKAIAAAFGIPSFLLNMAQTGSLAYQNPGQLGEMWWRFELRPTATRIANAFTAQLLPSGQWVSFDAQDTFAPILTPADDEQAAKNQPSQVAPASPAQQPRPLTAVGGGAP